MFFNNYCPTYWMYFERELTDCKESDGWCLFRRSFRLARSMSISLCWSSWHPSKKGTATRSPQSRADSHFWWDHNHCQEWLRSAPLPVAQPEDDAAMPGGIEPWELRVENLNMRLWEWKLVSCGNDWGYLSGKWSVVCDVRRQKYSYSQDQVYNLMYRATW